MIKVVFVKRSDIPDRQDNNKDFYLSQRGEKWQFKHCYILVGRVMLIHQHNVKTAELSVEEYNDLLLNEDGQRVFIDLPISGSWIINKRMAIKSSYWVNNRNYAKLWEEHFNPLAFTGVAYTCSNMVAKLLGWNDYYSLEPDDIYNRLTAK